MKTETARKELRELVRRTPFKPFTLTLETGEEILIEHPRNVGFNPITESDSQRRSYLGIVTSTTSLLTTLDAITAMTYSDAGEDTAA